MKLWLDDIRDPWRYGCVGWEWARDADEAIDCLETGRVTEISLDHDLSTAATMGTPAADEKTGYTVVCWMEEHNVWPCDGVWVHSMNPVGSRRMLDVIAKCFNGPQGMRRLAL